ncbi:hypothetical protein WA171_007390 [Blastocystis sp. BT1]
MPKLRNKHMKTIRKKMNTKNGRKRNKRGYTENQYHFDGSLCSGYCHLLTQEGYGYSWLVTHEDGKQFGDCGELFAILQVLCNSKAFIEFLCTFRHYAYAANLSKKSYFLLVFSSFLRDIAFASRVVPSSVEATRFITYCCKWIPELRGHLNLPSFLSCYMKKLEKELAAVNEYLFRMWAGRSIDKSSEPFNILTNPLCCIASISDATNLHQYSLYSIPLPICTVDKTLTLNQTLVPLSVPYLSIEQGLRMIDYPISSFGRCLILRCESDERNYSIPPFFSLQSTSDNMKVVLYSIRTVVCREKDTVVVYKRLFHPMWKKSQSRRIYDVHSIGQWVRQEADSIQEVSWRQVQRLCPLAIHYEKIEH